MDRGDFAKFRGAEKGLQANPRLWSWHLGSKVLTAMRH